MATLYNLARMSTTTTGTGTITLGSAVSGYLTFALAGVANGDVVSYGIKDGSNSEVGTGTYTSSGTTLTRTVTKSTNSNTAISLSGNAEVFITARAEDIPSAAVQSDQETATSTTKFVTPGVQQYHPSAAKAWVAWGVTSTIDVSFNVSSITDNGTGDWTINLTVPMSSANYVVALTIRDITDLSSSNFIGVKQGTAPTASACRVFCKSPTPTAVDPTKNYAAFFGDQ